MFDGGGGYFDIYFSRTIAELDAIGLAAGGPLKLMPDDVEHYNGAAGNVPPSRIARSGRACRGKRACT